MKVIINFDSEIMCFTTSSLTLKKENGFITFERDLHKCYIDDNVTIIELLKKFKSSTCIEFNAHYDKKLQEKLCRELHEEYTDIKCHRLKFKVNDWNFLSNEVVR